MWRALAEWTDEHPLGATLILTLLFEGVTALGRFAGDVQIARDTHFVAAATFGWRVHHSYLGAFLVAASLLQKPSAGRTLLCCVGAALVGSDLIHHFLVLWPLTGHHEFFLGYPAAATR